MTKYRANLEFDSKLSADELEEIIKEALEGHVMWPLATVFPVSG